MRIGIDARFYGPEGTGIGRYVEKLLENLEKIDSENEYFVFLRKSNLPLYNPKKANFHKITANAHWYSLKEQMIMPAALMNQKLDFVHFPHFNIPLLWKGKFVVTIHDLTLNKFENKKRKLPVNLAKKVLYNLTIKRAISGAEKIFTPSNYVKKEIIKNYQINSKKILVTYESAEEFGSLEVSPGKTEQVFNKFRIKEPYLVYVGNSYPYKNLDRLVEALLSVDTSVKLVCVTSRNGFFNKTLEKIKELGLTDRVVTTGYLGDEDLKNLFSRAKALVVPSLSEGFGLPGLEAMESDCPVIASNLTSLPEVYADAAEYFDPLSTESIATAINKVTKNKKLAALLVKKGQEQVKKYSWKKMAEETLQSYREIDKNL